MDKRELYTQRINQAIEAEFKAANENQTFFFKQDLDDLEGYLKAYVTFYFKQGHVRFPGGIRCMIKGHTPVFKHNGDAHYCKICLKKLNKNEYENTTEN